VGSAEYNLAIISDNKYNRRVRDRASREGNLQAWRDAERAIERGDNLLACAPTIEELAASVERARTHAEPNQKREALNLASELAASLVKRQGIEAVPTEYRPLVMHMQLSWPSSSRPRPLVEKMPSLARSNSPAPPPVTQRSEQLAIKLSVPTGAPRSRPRRATFSMPSTRPKAMKQLNLEFGPR
jgi:hypothetical protein